MKTKKSAILLIAFITAILCSSSLLHAQEKKTVTGTVKNEKGEPIASAAVSEKGAKNGTLTNEAGVFTLKVSPGATLEISAIGYGKMEEPVAGQSTVNFVLKSDGGAQLSDVVVTAMGVKREQRTLGYSIATIKGDDMTKAGNVQNPLTALYGQAAGVGLEVSSSGPTGSIKINVRGNTTLNADASTRPLIVVDGIPIYDANSSMTSRGYDPLHSFDYGTGINDLNAADIESIEILKGAKATVLYGSLAGNGVMMITTKRGKTQKGWGVNLSLQTELDHPVNYINFQNEYGSGTSVYDTAYAIDKNGNNVRALNNSRFSFGPKFDNARVLGYDSAYTTYRAYPNNYNDLFKDSWTTSATIAISGGNEKGNMRLSYTNKDYNGYIKNFYQKNNNISFNGMYKPSNFASFEVVGNLYSVKTHNRLPNIGRLVSNGMNRDIDFKYYEHMYKDNLGQYIQTDNYRFPYVFTGAGDGYFPIIWNQYENSYSDNKLHFIGSAKVNLTFTSWLSATLNAGADYTDWSYENESKATRLYPSIQGGGYSIDQQNYIIQNYSAFLNFNHKYINNNLDIFAYAGPAYYQQDIKDISATTVGGIQFQDWYSLNASMAQSGQFSQTRSSNRSTESLASILGNISIGWKGTYYLELSARNDRTSTLAPGDNSYFYPGASFTYNFSQNINVPKLTYGKFRVSVADVGRGAPSNYWAYPSYTMGVVQGTGAITISSPSSLFQPRIKPERKREYEIGFDTKWFKKTPLEVDFSFYTAMQYNQIMDLAITPSTGFGSTKVNAGKIRNYGYEFFVKYTPVLNKNNKLDLTLNLANQFSKVIKLYETITSYSLDASTPASYQIKAIEGQKTGQIMLYDYAKDPNGNRIVGENGRYSPDNTKLVSAGTVNPYLIGGFFLDYTYKRFNLHVGTNYKFGGTFLSYTNYYLLGQGLNKASLQYRDAEHGGLPYYINKSNKNVLLPSGVSSAPSDSKDGIVYHNGLILNGVRPDGNGGYVKNDIVTDAYSYYSGSYIEDNGEWFAPDNLYKNDYIKLRELSVSYQFPASIANKIKTQSLQLSVFSRNLFYIYKSIPNIDPESTQGSNSYIEYTGLPQTFSIGIKLDASF